VKNLGLFVAALSLLMQVFSTSLILLNYRVNTSYIIENFCENTDRPEMHCEGKCHLNKQIKTDSEQRSETPSSVSEILTIVLACQELSAIEFNFQSGTAVPPQSPYTSGHYSNHLQSVFHPPQV
jgi:hypothetical protein